MTHDELLPLTHDASHERDTSQVVLGARTDAWIMPQFRLAGRTRLLIQVQVLDPVVARVWDPVRTLVYWQAREATW